MVQFTERGKKANTKILVGLSIHDRLLLLLAPVELSVRSVRDPKIKIADTRVRPERDEAGDILRKPTERRETGKKTIF